MVGPGCTARRPHRPGTSTAGSAGRRTRARRSGAFFTVRRAARPPARAVSVFAPTRRPVTRPSTRPLARRRKALVTFRPLASTVGDPAAAGATISTSASPPDTRSARFDSTRICGALPGAGAASARNALAASSNVARNRARNRVRACITGHGFPRDAGRQPGGSRPCTVPRGEHRHGVLRRSPGRRRRRAGPRCARRRVRRHRHQPALRVPGGVRAPGPARSTRPTRSGVASIAFWALIIIISIKYLALVMRADNHGEGGILALTALVMPARRGPAAGSAGWCCSACSAPRCSTATGSSPRPSRCSARSRASRSRRRRSTTCVDPDGLRDPRRRCSSSSGAGTERGRQGVRPGDGRVVRRARRARPQPDRASTPAVLEAINPIAHRRLLRGRAGARRSSRSAASSWSSPAARRSTPTWATSAAGRSRIAWYAHRAARPAAQLLRPGGAADRRPRGHREPLLPAGAGLGRSRRSRSWPRWRRSSPRRRSSRGRSRSPCRRCSSTTCPASRILHTSADHRARSTCRSSTGR